ncbi:MAG: AAA family ATPase [Candidatus Moraniibacteriota bacterium]|jgi:dephospho-CoA kinase
MTRMVLGLAGEMASGKGTVSEYLNEKCDTSQHRFSTMLRDVLDRLHLENSRDNLQNLSTMLRQTYGEDTMARVMAEDAKSDAAEIIVIDGVRRMDDIKYLKELPEFKLVYIDVDIRTRYERIIQRSENVDDQNKTFEEFEAESKNESEAQVKGLKEFADVIINNSGSVEELHKQVDDLVDSKKVC